MGSPGATFDPRRALARAVWTIAVALLLAPVWLGPALGSVIALLGAHMEHHCACGMVRGKCGCEECQVVEAERHERRASAVPVFRTSCTDDAVDLEGALPATTAAEGAVVTMKTPGWHESAVAARAPRITASRERVPPPTPPPRTLAV